MEEAIQELKNIEGAIEAILYAAGYPVKYTKIAEVLGLDLHNTKTLIRHMAEGYNSDKSKYGIALLCFDDTCQFCTKEAYAPYIREALGIRRGGNLSASSMEVLAVVAYNQPVTRTFVDQVRGVDSSYAMNSLIDKALIEACGRLDAPGRPMLYVTTEKFLRVFGLQSLSELPATETLVPPKEETPIVAEETPDDDTADEVSE
jgi:segregation and condensation protein B